MLSGIGLAEELEPFGIAVRQELPVGRNLQDHCMVNVNYLTDEPGLFGIFTPENFALLESEGRGPLTSNYPEAGGFFRTRHGPAGARRRVPLRGRAVLRRGPDAAARQRLRVRPGDRQADVSAARSRCARRWPDSKPRVLCNFLTTEEDRASMLAGVRIALEIAAQPA